MRTLCVNLVDHLTTASRWMLGAGRSWARLLLLAGRSFFTFGWLTDTLYTCVHQPAEEITIRFVDSPIWIGESFMTTLPPPPLHGCWARDCTTTIWSEPGML